LAERKCVSCGDTLDQEPKFCPKCGSCPNCGQLAPRPSPAGSGESDPLPGYVDFMKAEYEFNKGLMTLNVAAIAASGAIIGGVFKDGRWLGEASNGGDPSRWVTIAVIFGLFIVSIFLASMAAWRESQLLMLWPHPKTKEAAKGELPLSGLSAAETLEAGLVAFIYFVVLSSVAKTELPTLLVPYLVLGVIVAVPLALFVCRFFKRKKEAQTSRS